MTRTGKKRKLANAIRACVGIYHGQSKKWIHAPQPDKLERVKHWLNELDLDLEQSLQAISNFQSLTDFHQWMRAIDQPAVICA